MSKDPATKRVAVVTGAAGGIGKAICARFIQDGYRVVGVDLDSARLADLTKTDPDNLVGYQADICARESPVNIMEFAIEHFGSVDILVNNAGIGGDTSLDASTDEQIDRFIDVNFRSVLRLSREAVRRMGPNSAIVHISSAYGLLGHPGSATYSAVKAALIGLTHQMAADYGPRGIRVNAVAPGLVRTPINQARFENDARFRLMQVDRTPNPRVGIPEDIAGAVGFLVSESSGYVNGHVLVVDGGWSVTNYLPKDIIFSHPRDR